MKIKNVIKAIGFSSIAVLFTQAVSAETVYVRHTGCQVGSSATYVPGLRVNGVCIPAGTAGLTKAIVFNEKAALAWASSYTTGNIVADYKEQRQVIAHTGADGIFGTADDWETFLPPRW